MMWRMTGRARLPCGAVCALGLLLVCAAPALAAGAPAWELVSTQTPPTQIPLTEPVSEVDTVTVSGLQTTPNVGHFSLEVETEAGETETTAPLGDGASAPEVQAALEGLKAVGRDNVLVTGGPQREAGKGQMSWSYAVTFVGALAGYQVDLEGEVIEASEAEEEVVENAGEEPEEPKVEVSVTTPPQRDTVAYELVASNIGGSPSSGAITVTDTLPAGLSTKTTPAGAGWSCTPAGEGHTTVTCTTEAVIEPGAKTAPITIEAYVGVAAIKAGAQLINTATISGGGASTTAQAIDRATAVRVGSPSGSSSARALCPGGHPAHGVSSARIAASLARQLMPSGRTATIAALRERRRLTVAFKALEPGTAAIDWYQVAPGARLASNAKPGPLLVGAGRLTFSAAGTGSIRIVLTPAGRRLMARATALSLTARGRFTPKGCEPVTVTRRFPSNVSRRRRQGS